MTRDMLVALDKAGDDIESHTWTHLALTRRPSEGALAFQNRIMRQMTLADTWLSQVVGQRAGCSLLPVRLLRRGGREPCQGGRLQAGVHDRRGRRRRPPVGRDGHEAVHRRSSRFDRRFTTRLNSGVMEARHIEPAPGTRVHGITTTVTVDITDVPAEVKDIKLSSGPSMKATDDREEGRAPLRGGSPQQGEGRLSAGHPARGRRIRSALLLLVEPGDGGLT